MFSSQIFAVSFRWMDRPTDSYTLYFETQSEAETERDKIIADERERGTLFEPGAVCEVNIGRYTFGEMISTARTK